MSNTIFAQCSAKGKAGVSVFRISGPNALSALSKLITHNYNQLKPRMLHLRKIYTVKTKQLIDEAMVVYFNSTSSFTGEDSVEIYTHGSLSVIKLLNQTLASMEDLRLAQPGEFAKRSFFNGKMDLTSAEGLADLIDAETEMQHKQAVAQLGGALEKVYEQWRQQILKIISLLEAYIDFPDEDIPQSTILEVENKIKSLTKSINNHLNDNNRGERLRNGIKLTIIGRPNAGKSSLVNHIMQRDLSIVSDIAGTTRDIIEGYIDISGYPIILQDTAGININTNDKIEQQGIEKALNAARDSDIKIIIYDGLSNDIDAGFIKEISDENTIIVRNKIDLLKNNHPAKMLNNIEVIDISAKKGLGFEGLYKKIVSICDRIASPSDSPQITRARYRAQLERAMENLSRFSIDNDLVLATEDLRMTAQSISNITGKITVDEILGEIFSNFCIGK